MDTDEARFGLLIREMEAIQAGIQSMDTAMFRIKGWCITIAAAVMGVAISQNRPVFLLIGLATTPAFWFVDSYFKMIQRVYIKRDLEIARSLAGKDPLVVLSERPDLGGLYVPDLAWRFLTPANSTSKVLRLELRDTLREAFKPVVSMLYVFVLACLGIAWPLLAC